MNTMRIAQAALATILTVGINSTTYAFMAVPTEESTAVERSITETVDALRHEIEAGQTGCEEMLAKVNGVLEEIDTKLDAGVSNEAEYLAARKEVAKMRYDLECLAKELAVENGLEVVIGDPAADAVPVAPGAPVVPGAPVDGAAANNNTCSVCGGPTGTAAVQSGGGYAGGGGYSGGSGGGGGGGFAAGALPLILIPALIDDNDGPGFVASISD